MTFPPFQSFFFSMIAAPRSSMENSSPSHSSSWRMTHCGICTRSPEKSRTVRVFSVSRVTPGIRPLSIAAKIVFRDFGRRLNRSGRSCCSQRITCWTVHAIIQYQRRNKPCKVSVLGKYRSFRREIVLPFSTLGGLSLCRIRVILRGASAPLQLLVDGVVMHTYLPRNFRHGKPGIQQVLDALPVFVCQSGRGGHHLSNFYLLRGEKDAGL